MFDSRRRDGSESLLSGCVPYLQFHLLSVKLHRPDLEVDSYSGDVTTYNTKSIEYAIIID